MMVRWLLLLIALLFGVCLLVVAHGDHAHHGHAHHHHDDSDDEDDIEPKPKIDDLPKLDPEEVEYHKGSLCGYCEYCKVALLCFRRYFRRKVNLWPQADACK